MRLGRLGLLALALAAAAVVLPVGIDYAGGKRIRNVEFDESDDLGLVAKQ